MKFTTTLLLFLISLTLFAQSNYQKGSVKTQSGQTITGYIDYREWIKSPKTILFKVVESGKAQTFNPTTIQYFEVDGLEKYFSYTGRISIAKIQFPDLQIGLDTTTVKRTIFIKQIATGKNISMFESTDSIKTRYFVQPKDSAIYELIYRHYYDENAFAKKSTIYLGQLSLLLTKYVPNNNKLEADLKTTDYTASDLINIADGINESKEKRKGTPIRLFVGAAASSISTKFDGKSDFSTSGTSSTVAPKLSFGMDVFNNPNVQSFLLRAELSLASNSATFKAPKTQGTFTGTETYTFSQFTVALTPQMIFNIYNKENFKYFLGAGVSFNYSTYPTNKASTDNPSILLFYNPYKLESFWTSFPVKTGFVINKKLEVSLAYSYYAPYTSYSDFNIESQFISLGVNYLLDKKRR
jgi:hypothetical protein